MGFPGQALTREGPTDWQPPEDASPGGRQAADLGSDWGGLCAHQIGLFSKIKLHGAPFPHEKWQKYAPDFKVPKASVFLRSPTFAFFLKHGRPGLKMPMFKIFLKLKFVEN